MVIQTPLTSSRYPGLVALVDDEDAELIGKVRSWCPTKGRTGRLYATGYVGSGRRVRMHRLILPDTVEVDHVNGNTLDNRRSNLRPATDSQNGGNRGPNKNNTSGFKGVYWYRPSGKWRAEIRNEGRKYCLGLFDAAEVAASAYDCKARELFGEFAWTNFPADQDAGSS